MPTALRDGALCLKINQPSGLLSKKCKNLCAVGQEFFCTAATIAGISDAASLLETLRHLIAEGANE
jgi:hypothetical protein